MIVTLITKKRISTISLPNRVSGRYWLLDQDEAGQSFQLADIEGIQGQWLIRSSALLALLDDVGVEVDSRTLQDGMQVINAFRRKDRQKIQLFVEPSTEDRQRYQKYLVNDKCRINIGRASDNQIKFDNRYVSSHHACLIWDKEKWSITDTQSSNGTFVNDRRIATTVLAPGDIIYIMGLKIVVGSAFFAVNSPDGRMELDTSNVTELQTQKRSPLALDYREYPGKEPFYRSPRNYQEIVSKEIKIDAPPPQVTLAETPLPLILGPAVTMGVTAIVMGAIAVNNLVMGNATIASSLPTIIMSFSMLCGTLLWPPLTKRHEKKQRIKAELLRQTKYREYLDEIQDHIFAIGIEQKKILQENCPTADECEQRVLERDRRLWERTNQQSDFLCLRLGSGSIPLKADLKVPEARFSIENDALVHDMLRLADAPQMVSKAPFTCSLLKYPVIGIAGDEKETEEFVQSLVLQLFALHSYDEIKLIFLVGDTKRSAWSYSRLLPHTWDEKTDIRYYATDETEVRVLSTILERIIEERRAIQDQNKCLAPHYIIIAADLALATKAPFFMQTLSGPEDIGFSCIAIAEQITHLPKECDLVVAVNGDQSVLYDHRDTSAHKEIFIAEGTTVRDMNRIADVIANLALDASAETHAMPNMVTFLEMYGVGKVEHLNALARWKDNDPVNTLRTPVGIEQNGDPFYLDLHEKAHGPHGLIAGMTGSGKSEFIITMILSMTVNYHPDEVSFILIDYKGGGLAGAFENTEAGIHLPHLAGTITNLDGAAVNRALISIQSELRRRQAIFNRVRQISGDGTIDIYKYQKMYRSGLVEEPIPHLFIISDEFAELKMQQPDFMTQLVSAARIGRSLGVHLILATQKPTGVVDDQIWSNSRFRICLKVQDRADSVEMLKRPDAAKLKETGRFYLQVGFNELFRVGQSAWCGAPYLPVDRIERKRDDSVVVIDSLGQPLLETKQKMGVQFSDKSQVVSIVEYLSDLAAGEHIAAKQLWLPPIPEKIYLDELEGKYRWSANALSIAPIVGEYDDPSNQTQGLLTLPLSENGNALIYGMTGSGKSTLLDTILFGLIRSYSPEQLHIYIIDLGEETLRAFEKAPQVGDVMLAEDGEKIQNLFKLISAELSRRRRLFAESGGDFSAYCSSTGLIVPNILVIMRNYAAFFEQFEILDNLLSQITRDCSKYGIHFILTANTANSVRYRVTQNFSNVLCLQLNDNSDYVALFGKTEGVYPSKIKGRGIFKTQSVYEFQTAYCGKNISPQDIRTFAEEQAQLHESRVPPVPVLPKMVTADFFQETISASALPVGIEKVSLQPSCLDLERAVITLLLTKNQTEMSAVAQGLNDQLARLDGTVTVWDGVGLIVEPSDFSYSYVRNNFLGSVECLFNEMIQRNNSYKTAIKNELAVPGFDTRYYIITGLQIVFDTLTDDGRDKLAVLLEKAELEYQIRFILCDTAKGMNNFTLTSWYKKHISGSDGIWVGDGISDQYVLKVNKITNDLYSEIPPYFGYVVKRGKPVLTKLIVGKQMEEADDR